jgi:hypothetical protein
MARMGRIEATIRNRLFCPKHRINPADARTILQKAERSRQRADELAEAGKRRP